MKTVEVVLPEVEKLHREVEKSKREAEALKKQAENALPADLEYFMHEPSGSFLCQSLLEGALPQNHTQDSAESVRISEDYLSRDGCD